MKKTHLVSVFAFKTSKLKYLGIYTPKTEQLHNCVIAAFILPCSTSPTLFDTLIVVSQIQLSKQLNPFRLFAL